MTTEPTAEPIPEPTPEWQPANDAERALVRALTDDDRQEYFRILATTDLYLPQVSEEAGGAQTFITGEMFGQTMLPVYTSLEGLTAAVAGVADAYTVTDAAQLLQLWPQPHWQLAVNPGYPIDAYLPIEAVAAAASGTVRIPTAAEVVVDGFSQDAPAAALLDTGALLRDAAGRNDPGAYIDALLDATVIVPTARAVTHPERILDEDDPWRPAGTAGAPAVEVFTAAATFAAAFHPTEEVPSVTMPFVLLLGAWPDGAALAVDPRTDIAVELPAGQVQELLLWTPSDEPSDGLPDEPADSPGSAAHRGL